jgi:hypothetical protein
MFQIEPRLAKHFARFNDIEHSAQASGHSG